MALPPKTVAISNDHKNKNRTRWFREWHARDIFHIILILTVHALCLYAPSNFNWNAFRVAGLLSFSTGLFGMTLSYHRNLSHRSFKLPKYLEYLFAYFGLQALQGHPIFWVSTHRYHHKFADTDHDPHSPIKGFVFSHIWWLFSYANVLHKNGYYKNVEDLNRQNYYRLLQKTYLLHVCLLPALLYIFGGFPFVVWGMGVRTVLVYHGTFIMNSVCHIWGHQAWNTGDLSKNNWVVALINFGEGWHNNHHAFEFSARLGLEWWQIDPAWYIIKSLEHVGLATNVKLPSKTHKQKMSFENGLKI
ncbi:hypothetical protein AQUCO_00800281v1 [Aquilegia coerulea]|uniref:Fatty acid desaturase domain-containing protein n=1 Tax=Aquilegia coerulea TaxID=218851 RepID=A0A2G5EI23_AQUCA|nr:hypothetical protein AQUCO_00800281v1 [Aquilegia coerulea]